MSTLEILEQYSQACDEVDRFMQQENGLLRNQASEASKLERQKVEIVQKLTDLLIRLRGAEPPPAAHRRASEDLRQRVMQKLLKLLLLSRESEQLLLKSAVPVASTSARVVPSAARLKSAYQIAKPAHESACA